MQKLKLNLITTTFISLFCLLSILSFGQNTKNTAPKLNAANSKNTGMRINHNANAGEIGNTAKPVQKLWGQGKIGKNEESFAKLWKNEPFGEQNISKELVEKRDAYAKHFANDDGSISAHIASGPIHYKEKNEWKTIFHTITPTANGFENIHNSHKTYYPASATESLTTVLENGEVLRDMINMNMYFSVNGEKVHLKTIQDNKGRADFNQLTYPNAYGNGIDLQLTHETTKRKMDYVIHNREAIGDIPNNASHLVFEETIELPIGWKAELKDNIIYIKDGKGEIQVLYEKPFLEDSPNFDKLPKENITEKDSKDLKSKDIRKINLRDEGEYSIKQNGNLLTIQTAVTIDWITSEERQFPVKVDPTNVYPNDAANWSRSVANDGWNYSNLYFGNDASYWIAGSVKFNISSISVGSTINSIVGYINAINLMGTTYANSPWQFSNSADPTTTSGLALFNSMTLGYSNIVNSRPSTGWKSSSFYDPEGTQLLEDALINGTISLGIVTGGSYYNNEIVQVANHTSVNRPYLSINYTIPSGPPSCTTPISPLNGASGTAHSGNLAWEASAGATSYNVYFGQNYPPTTMVGNTANQYYDVDNLDYNTTYYWQILPTNAGGTASGCDVWSFTTGAASPQFHNYGGTEQLTFDNSAYKADAPNFRISHPSTMEEVQIQISQDVSFPGTSVYDGNFTGSFTGENNFETALSGQVLNESYFPQTFDTDVLTHGTNPGSDDIWFAPSYSTPIAWTATGGNPGGRVGYSGSLNNFWGNFLRLPEIDASGMDEITLSFDVWHSYFAAHPNDKLYLSAWADGGYINLPQTVKIDGVTVTASANIGSSGYAFNFTEERAAAKVEITLDISGISNKSEIMLFLNADCPNNNSNLFYIYFDNVSVTGETQQLTDGTTYYARTRGKIGGNWTAWTTKTHSFTYKNQTDIEWYQNMEPQFLTDEMDGTETTNDVVKQIISLGGDNAISNPGFSGGLASWTVTGANTSWNLFADVLGSSDPICTSCNLPGANNLRMGSPTFGTNGPISGDKIIVAQKIDLTDVNELKFDVAAWYNLGSPFYDAANTILKFKIGGTLTNDNGTELSITAQTQPSSYTFVEPHTVTVNTSGITGIHVIKFVLEYNASWHGNGLIMYYISGIDAPVSGDPDGTLTSTPINLSSFYGDDSWHELSWNQALNGGSIAMSIEEDNGGTWTPVAGFTNITQTGDGVKTVDISSLSSISRIRVIAKFSETGAKGTQPELNNWIIKTKKDEPLPVELLYFNVKCNGSDKEFSWVTASETNSDYFLIMASEDTRNFKPVAKIQAAGYSSQNIEYTYTLKGLNNKVYYRLQQIDFDGNSETFQIIYADCNKMSNFEITAYPNPFDGKILYLNSTSTLKNAVINIYDALGRLVYQTNRNEINSHTEIKIDSQLEPGAYYLEISSKNELNKRISIIVK